MRDSLGFLMFILVIILAFAFVMFVEWSLPSISVEYQDSKRICFEEKGENTFEETYFCLEK